MHQKVKNDNPQVLNFFKAMKHFSKIYFVTKSNSSLDNYLWSGENKWINTYIFSLLVLIAEIIETQVINSRTEG